MWLGLDPAPPGRRARSARDTAALWCSSVKLSGAEKLNPEASRFRAYGRHFPFCFPFHGVGDVVLAMLGTDCSCQHCAQGIYLPRSLAPQGRILPGSRDQATAGEMGQSRGPHLWGAQIPGGQSLDSPHPPRVGRSVPGRQDWVGTRACLEPPRDEIRSNVRFDLVFECWLCGLGREGPGQDRQCGC